jgi:hypothetical protein
MITLKHKRDQGFVILYAVLLTTITLAIGLLLLAVIAKQIQLSSIEKNSQLAYYAADAGRQCALYYDAPTQNRFGRVVDGGAAKTYEAPANSDNINCFDKNFSVTVSGQTFTFFQEITYTQSAMKACVSVKVEKDVNSGTTITSKGYNTSNCDPNLLNQANPRRVERTIVTVKE